MPDNMNGECHKGGMACEKQCGYEASDNNNNQDCRMVMEEVCGDVAKPRCKTVMESVCDPVQEEVCEKADVKSEPQTRSVKFCIDLYTRRWEKTIAAMPLNCCRRA